ncbi:hypothetical protein D3C76_1727320 [compost metagenome]
METFKAFRDTLRGKVGNPQSFYGLGQFELLLDEGEYVLSFPPGVTGIHDRIAPFGHFPDRL